MASNDDWRELSVSEFAEVIGGTTPSTSISSHFGGDVPWITPKDLSNFQGRYISRGERNITREGVEAAGLQILPKGTVLLSTRAPVGYVAIAANALTTNQGFRNLVVKSGFEAEYVFYLLKQNTDRLKSFASGTTFGELSGSTLKRLRFSIPPLSEQRAIARVLGTLDDEIVSRKGESKGLRRIFDHLMRHLLDGSWSIYEGESWLREVRPLVQAYDDKIELNRRMSQTLEEICRALFKFWFVDFGPVRAKAEGRWKKGKSLPGMPADMWDFWPSEFEESEIGEIPKGWEIEPVSSIAEVNPERRLAKGDVAPYVEMGHLPISSARVDGWVERAYASGSRFKNGDVLVARITPCLENGKTAYVDFLRASQIGWGSTEFLVLSAKAPLPSQWMYCLARTDDFRAHLIQNMTGTSGRQRAPAECLESFMVAVPTDEVAERFGQLVVPWFERLKANDGESSTLTAARDALLPKLLSGELRVPFEGGA